MVKTSNISENLKSLCGGIFVGLGLHILSGNLSWDAVQLRSLLDLPAADTLGLLPSIALATSHATKTYALDHAKFLNGLLYMLASFWPILLVIVGSVLLRNALTDKVKVGPAPNRYFRNKYFQNKGAGCRFRCPSFDV